MCINKNGQIFRCIVENGCGRAQRVSSERRASAGLCDCSCGCRSVADSGYGDCLQCALNNCAEPGDPYRRSEGFFASLFNRF